MKGRREWLALLSMTVLLFSNIEAQQRKRSSNPPAKTARSSTAYDAYVGQYLLPGRGQPEGNVITITKIGNRLTAEQGLNVFELVPQSGNKFIHKFNDREALSFTFIKDANGHVPRIKITSESAGGDGYPARNEEIVNRISSLAPYTPGSQQLSEYIGQYKNNEFPTREPTDIILEGGVLFSVSGPGFRKQGLFPDSKDRFLLKRHHAILTFMRDQRGKITHIEVVEPPSEKYILHRL
ncbi:MAG TPA: DUF3471 domain-containing protein [Pyrinomonadaceae bacterium]|nr:DUF3471 domain-containing protein [Pyrinomonadaceae bacterium]